MTYEAIKEQSASDLLKYTVNESKVDDLITYYGSLRNLGEATLDELLEQGLTKAKATKLLAVLHIARMYASEPVKRTTITHPSHIYDLMRDMELLDRESFKTVILDTKNHVQAITHISSGTLDSCIAAPREVFKPAIMRSAASLILVHNHPSGISEPSQQDIDLTRRLKSAGEIIGIHVLDHVVIGKGCFTSFKEFGML